MVCYLSPALRFLGFERQCDLKQAPDRF